MKIINFSILTIISNKNVLKWSSEVLESRKVISTKSDKNRKSENPIFEPTRNAEAFLLSIVLVCFSIALPGPKPSHTQPRFEN